MNQHDFMTFEFNSSPLSAAYMHQWIGTDRIGTDNDLSPIRRQAIISNNTGLLLIGPWGTNFSKILKTKYETFINENASENIVCEMAVILSPGRLVEINFCGISYMQKVNLYLLSASFLGTAFIKIYLQNRPAKFIVSIHIFGRRKCYFVPVEDLRGVYIVSCFIGTCVCAYLRYVLEDFWQMQSIDKARSSAV